MLALYNHATSTLSIFNLVAADRLARAAHQVVSNRFGAVVSAFVVVEANVLNAEVRDEYAQLAAPIIERFGGNPVAFGPWQELVGQSDHKVGMIVQFEDRKAAESWFNSPEYQALKDLRSAAIECRFRLLG
ncbi:DUF1330 domain-containing protein [Rhizobium jaguaris]|nr:DUF1330 domain-containing protein [Rhizobium jaguaris]